MRNLNQELCELMRQKEQIHLELRALQIEILVERFGARKGDIITVVGDYNESVRGKRAKIVDIPSSDSSAYYLVVPENKDGSWSEKAQTLYINSNTKITVIK